MKRIISIVLVLSIMFAAAGCGNTAPEAPAPGNSDDKYENLILSSALPALIKTQMQ